MNDRHRRIFGVALCTLAVIVLLARETMACAVCYGAADSPMTQGMNNGILVLLGFVGLVYLGVGRLFWTIWRRSRKLALESRRFQVLEGGKR